MCGRVESCPLATVCGAGGGRGCWQRGQGSKPSFTFTATSFPALIFPDLSILQLSMVGCAATASRIDSKTAKAQHPCVRHVLRSRAVWHHECNSRRFVFLSELRVAPGQMARSHGSSDLLQTGQTHLFARRQNSRYVPTSKQLKCCTRATSGSGPGDTDGDNLWAARRQALLASP